MTVQELVVVIIYGGWGVFAICDMVANRKYKQDLPFIPGINYKYFATPVWIIVTLGVIGIKLLSMVNWQAKVF